MKDLDRRVARAVRHFWTTRERQSKRAKARDQGSRSAVTGGAQLDGFRDLIHECLVESGIPEATVYRKVKRKKGKDARSVILPGYFRATKEWDLLVVADETLLATIELKSQVGSFGNNYNNRSEEAVGNATDLWTAYREGAFKKSPRPWAGYFMLLEEAKGSTRPVAVREPHFSVFEEFRGASYGRRYELLCQRLVRERLYDAATLILSDRVSGLKGGYKEPSEELSVRNFIRSLTATAIAYAKSRRDRA